jgi:membrane carboxypeptidase/penicillin-binding protein
MLASPSLIRRVEDASGRVLYMSSPHVDRAISEATAFIMTSMMSDVINGRDRMAGPPRRLHAAGGRKDRHDKRLSRCMVHRIHAAPGDRCVDRLRHAADDHRQWVCR